MMIRSLHSWHPTLKQRSSCQQARCGFTQTEFLVIALLFMVFVTVTVPNLLKVRCIARATECKLRMSQVTRGLQNYHDVFQSFPPAAVWNAEATRSSALHISQRIDLFTHENWAQLILPFIGEENVGRKFDPAKPVSAPQNLEARTTPLSVMNCPDDHFNSVINHYEFTAGEQLPVPVFFARGNYAINGGTQSLPVGAPTTSSPNGDYSRLIMQRSPKSYQLWGNGIAGINRSFSIRNFKNGQSHLVAIDEIRAGIHPLDPRGVWALGQIGGSMTWAHGIGSDAFGPNNSWARSDDILGCRELHAIYGEEKLVELGMPCVHYVNENRQATARSLHAGGAHVSFLDGSVRFIGDAIDPGIWHVIHSRETPDAVFDGDFETLLETEQFSEERLKTDRQIAAAIVKQELPPDSIPALGQQLTNSIGMTFQNLAAGTFRMGTPDRGNFKFFAENYPIHDVTITQDFLLGTHEVTQQQYFEIMQSPPETVSSSTSTYELVASHPIVNVTWYEAEEFCQKLSAVSAERKAGRCYRLPTEAEWEYACRAGRESPYRWRKVRAPQDASGDAGGILPHLPLATVGSYPANSFGLFDMRGNAWEWTADWFDRDYYERSPKTDPQGPQNGFIKVVRGSDWRYVGEICHIDYPMMPPWIANPCVGFRVVCEVNRTE